MKDRFLRVSYTHSTTTLSLPTQAGAIEIDMATADAVELMRALEQILVRKKFTNFAHVTESYVRTTER